jgi:hypothetical protein
MGKKTTTPSSAVKPAAKQKPATAKAAAAKTTKPKTVAKAMAPKAPSFTQDDIALRAYYIAEKRQQQGLPGDESSDWIEAERQLLAESKKPVKRTVRPKAAKK